jgi:hypothetical protein
VLKISSRLFPLIFVVIRLAMAREMTSKAGEDVCGSRMASIDCVMVSMPVEESELWVGQKKLQKRWRDSLPRARSSYMSSKAIERLADDGRQRHWTAL